MTQLKVLEKRVMKCVVQRKKFRYVWHVALTMKLTHQISKLRTWIIIHVTLIVTKLALLGINFTPYFLLRTLLLRHFFRTFIVILELTFFSTCPGFDEWLCSVWLMAAPSLMSPKVSDVSVVRFLGGLSGAESATLSLSPAPAVSRSG